MNLEGIEKKIKSNLEGDGNEFGEELRRKSEWIEKKNWEVNWNK